MQYDFSLAPGAAQRFEVVGKFFKNTASTGLIRVSTSKGEYVDLKPGQGIYGVGFSWLSVKDISGAANVGSIIIGDFDFRDDTINGTIKLIDDAYVKVRNKDTRNSLLGNSFVGMGNIYPVSTTVYNSLILYNPASSGKNCVITKMQMTASGPSNIDIHSGVYVPAGVNKCRNKMLGGADSSTILATAEDVATATIAAMGRAVMGPNGLIQTTKTSERYDFTDPIILPPNRSLIIHNAAATQTTNSEWFIDFWEEPV